MSSLSLKSSILVIAVSGVTTLNVFLSGALTVALPTIGNDLHFKQADLQWPLNVYYLSYGCLLLFFGRVGDIIGGRFMFLVGTVWFAIWSIATAFAPNDKAFIAFVALTGLGAAANTPAAIGVFTATFPPGHQRNRAFGALGAGQPIGFILGLVLGGVLCQSRATWRAIFYIQTGLAALYVVTGWLVIAPDHITRKYTKGLDWGGALLSTIGIGMLTYSLAGASTARGGWGSPHILGLLVASIVTLVLFLFYERWREAHQRSVLMPLSMWRRPGAKMGIVIALVFFAWWSFNALVYFSTLYYQQVNLLNPLQTAIRFIPMIISGFIINLGTGYIMSRVPSQPLMLLGLLGNVAAPLIFALIDVNSSYWAMAFFVMILVVGADVVYPVGTLQISSAFDDDSQSLAGGVFNVATRIGTSLGLAVTSTIATSVSQTYAAQHPGLASDSPEVLTVGFRAAGWTCLATGAISILIGLVGLRGIGIVGQQKKDANVSEDIDLQTISHGGNAGLERAASKNAETVPQYPEASQKEKDVMRLRSSNAA